MNIAKKLLGRWVHFHEWEYVKDYYLSFYMGVEIKEFWNRWRRCKICGKVQEKKSCSSGCYWDTSTQAERDVFLAKKHTLKKENNELSKI